MYSINFTVIRKKFSLSFHYNWGNGYLFVNDTKTILFKAKVSEIVITPLFLGNISEDFSAGNMKKRELNEYVYDFSVNYDVIAVLDILDIQVLMKNNDIA